MQFCMMARMEWSDLRVFLAIARAGTLGAAARALGQTQPIMGRRLRALEQAVGQALFQRTSDGFVLTAEGAAVLAHAERVEEEAIAFERRLAGRGETLEGMLRISASDWFGARCWRRFSPASPVPILASWSSWSPMPGCSVWPGARPTWWYASGRSTSRRRCSAG